MQDMKPKYSDRKIADKFAIPQQEDIKMGQAYTFSPRGAGNPSRNVSQRREDSTEMKPSGRFLVTQILPSSCLSSRQGRVVDFGSTQQSTYSTK